VAWSVLQSASNSPGGGGTVTATYTSNLSAGSTLVAVGVCFGGTSTSVADASANSFIKITSQLMNGSAANGDVSLWALNTPPGDVGAKPVITFISSGSSAIWIGEVSGLVTSGTAAGFTDGTAGVLGGETPNSGGTRTIGPPTYASSASSEFLIYVYGDTGQGVTYTAPGGYTLDPHSVNGSGNNDIGVAYKNSTAGTETGTWTLGTGIGNPIDWSLILVAFQIASTVNVVTPLTPPRMTQSVAMVPFRAGPY
jgi:hypothetical protein